MKKMLSGLSKLDKICIVIVLLSGFYAMTTINYSDLTITSSFGVKIWDQIFSGRFFQFYQDTIACYPITIHLIFGIWNLPIYLIETFGHISLVGTLPYMIWNKLLLYLFAVMCAYIIDKIAIELGFSMTKRRITFFLFISSYFILYSILLVGQYDIFSLFFMLLGFLALLKNDQKRFILYFAIAITFKEFAAVLFIPLLLYTNTKIRDIIKKCLLVLIPLVLTHQDGLIFGWWKYHGSTTTGLERRILRDQFFADTQMFRIGTYYISPFILAFVLLCIFCYCTKRKNDRNMMLYISAISMAIFSIVLFVNPYWPLLMIPFVLLMIMNYSQNTNISVLLETIATGAMVVMFMLVNYYWCTDNFTKTNTLLSAIFGENTVKLIGLDPNTLRLLNFVGTDFFSSAIRITFSSIVIACFIAIFVFSYPKKDKNLCIDEGPEVFPSFKILRTIGFVLICLIPTIELVIFL